MGWFIRFENVVILMGIYKSGTVKKKFDSLIISQIRNCLGFFRDKKG